jgi:hypothetical protein
LISFFFLIYLKNFSFFVQVVLFKIPYPGCGSVGVLELTEAFQMAANMPVVEVRVSGGVKVARVKFP